MKIGIDSYSFHRFFGEVYPEQPTPDTTMTLDDFLEFAKELGVDAVALDSWMLPGYPDIDDAYVKRLKVKLDDYGLDRVYGWGHPDGLEAGKNRDMFDQMLSEIPYAKMMGADVMRVVGSSLMFRHEPHQPQLDILAAWFKEAAPVAEQQGVKLAVENHIDYTADECLWLLEEVNSPWLGLNFDTGNFLRLLDDPLKGMAKLAKYTLSTHLKDLKVREDAAPDDWFFFSSTPVGDGLVDNLQLARTLQEVDFEGFLAVEIDHLHPDYNYDEHAAIRQSVDEMRRIVNSL